MKTVIKNARIVNEGTISKSDILINGDLIQEMYLTFNVNPVYDALSITKLETPSLSNNTIISRNNFTQQMKNILYKKRE